MARDQERDDRRKAEERRRAETQAREAERKRLEMNQNNFPTLGGGGGWTDVRAKQPTMAAAISTVYATLAKEWQVSDEASRLIAESNRKAALRNENERFLESGAVYMHRRRMKSYDYSAGAENYQDDLDDYHRESTGYVRPKADVEGWVDVEHKKARPKRELTNAELDAKYAHSAESDNEDGEINTDLFDRKFKTSA